MTSILEIGIRNFPFAVKSLAIALNELDSVVRVMSVETFQKCCASHIASYWPHSLMLTF